MPTTPDKPALRAQMKATLASIPPATLGAASIAICARIASSPHFASAHTILLFTPLPGEIDLTSLAQTAAVSHKRLALTRMDWSNRTLKPVLVDRWGVGLVPGRYGVLEPGPEAMTIPVAELALVIVPGLAFDSCRNRLGRGAGFYDRFLSSPDLTAPKVGVALEQQIVPHVPCESHDAILDAIATPDRWIMAP